MPSRDGLTIRTEIGDTRQGRARRIVPTHIPIMPLQTPGLDAVPNQGIIIFACNNTVQTIHRAVGSVFYNPNRVLPRSGPSYQHNVPPGHPGLVVLQFSTNIPSLQDGP